MLETFTGYNDNDDDDDHDHGGWRCIPLALLRGGREKKGLKIN